MIIRQDDEGRVFTDRDRIGMVWRSVDFPGKWALSDFHSSVQYRLSEDEALTALVSLWAMRNGA